MNCLECQKELKDGELNEALVAYQVPLCSKHKKRLDGLIKKHNTPVEAIQLYYGLKQADISPMLEWWNGKRSVDIAISRAKLNIIIDTEYDQMTHEEAISDLEQTMHSFKNGFTTIRIPHTLVKHYLFETVQNIIGIVEGIKANVRAI